LTPAERRHETAFANDVEQNIEHFIEGADLIAHNTDVAAFEPDAIKRLYAPWGVGSVPSSASERAVRAQANHALHPAATIVARLAFLKQLDALALLPETDPKRTIIATSGGCAAGKGDMDEAIKAQQGGFPFGAMWDSAGESNALENAWVLKAAEARGLKVVFAFAANDAAPQFEKVLDRGERTGRFVDVLTFAGSYVEGTRNMRAFLESPEYQRAATNGTATTLAMFMGEYDKRAETDKTLPHYPFAKLLGERGLITAADLPPTPTVAELVASSLAVLEREVEKVKAKGGDVEGLLLGALGNAEKFARAGLLAQLET
jgi:hypothetical protein